MLSAKRRKQEIPTSRRSRLCYFFPSPTFLLEMLRKEHNEPVIQYDIQI